MGCRASKVDDLPLVIRCRERKRLMKCAVEYRYDLSSTHVAYFHSLKEIGYVFSRFVDEQLVIPSPPPASPVLTLPVSENIHSLSDSDSGSQGSGSELSRSLDGHIHVHNNNNNDNDDEEDNGNHGGGGFERSRPRGYDERNVNEPYQQQPPPYYQPQWGEPYNPSAFPYQPPWGRNQTSWGEGQGQGDPYATQYQPPWGANQTSWGEGQGDGDPYATRYQPPWGPYDANFNSYDGHDGNSDSNPNPNRYAYYMKKSAPASRTVFQQGEARGFQETNQWVDPSYYNGYGSFYDGGASTSQEPQKPKSPPPPPPPPAMDSDYFNFFNTYDNEYSGYGYGYGFETMDSSPDVSEVRAREGIPELEEETETESHYEEAVNKKTFTRKRNIGEGKDETEGSSWKETSTSTEGSSGRKPPEKSEGTAKTANVESTSNSVPLGNKERAHSVNTDVGNHSSETIVSQSTEESHEGKKGVSVDNDEGSTQELDSSILSSLTTLSPHGSRDLHDVVNEIKDEFESAFSHGKEVALMLEAGKLPYQSKFAVLKVMLSKILYPLAPSSASSDHPVQSERSWSRVTKLAASYNEDAIQDVRPINLSSTLEKLYAWEKKLYKEVKGEERIRVIYEKMCKRLNKLDAKGAESSKIDATQTSIRRLKTKLNVSIKAIDVISCEIHKVRDKELQPQLSALIYGLIRMWQSIVRCHRKQFEAIMDSRSRTLRANTSLERDSSLKTTVELETGLVMWAQDFNNWINAQKSYVNSLNGWLQQCIDHKPEVTVEGEVPFSPGLLGAPPIFVICNDWYREIKGVSQEGVLNAMHSFALSLRQLLERQDGMQRLMLKKEQLAKDRRDETHGSVVPSEDRASLDYKEAMRLVQNGGSSSLQGGVIPIFKALEMFTRDALKAHEHIRLT